jgi:hypothetical protein
MSSMTKKMLNQKIRKVFSHPQQNYKKNNNNNTKPLIDLSKTTMDIFLLLIWLCLLPLQVILAWEPDTNLALCATSLEEADANQDGILDRDEFQTFCRLEAKRTPMMLFANDWNNIFATTNHQVPQKLMEIFNASSTTTGRSRGIHYTLSDPQAEQAVLHVLCGDVVSQISDLLEDEAIVADEAEERPGTSSSSNKKKDNNKALDEPATVKIEAKFVLSNTQGLTASDVQSQYLENFIQAFQESIQDSGFDELVAARLAGQEQSSQEEPDNTSSSLVCWPDSFACIVYAAPKSLFLTLPCITVFNLCS